MGTYERLAILGGADPIDPLEPNNRLRHVAVGGLLTCVAVWACVAVAGVFHSSLKMPWPVAIFVGLLIAGVIFFIDVLITCTPLKEDRARYRARIVLIRGMISLAMGLVISQATIVFMYEDTLAQIVSAKNQAVAQADAKRIQAHSQWAAAIAAAQGQVAADRKQIQGADSTFRRAQAELDRSRRAWLNDRLCVNGTQRAADGDLCGNGNVANPLRKAYEELNGKFPAQQHAHNQTVSSLSAAITSLNNTVTADRSRLSAEIRGGIRADLANTGLAAQSEALWTLLRGDVFVWLWPVFFIAVDMAVALMRGILPESDFDRRRRRDREQDDAVNAEAKASSVWREVAHHAASRRAEVAMARIDAIANQEIASLRSRSGSSAQSAGETIAAATPVAAQEAGMDRKRLCFSSTDAGAHLCCLAERGARPAGQRRAERHRRANNRSPPRGEADHTRGCDQRERAGHRRLHGRSGVAREHSHLGRGQVHQHRCDHWQASALPSCARQRPPACLVRCPAPRLPVTGRMDVLPRHLQRRDRHDGCVPDPLQHLALLEVGLGNRPRPDNPHCGRMERPPRR